MYVMDQQFKWEDYLPLVEFAYNKNYHRSLGMAPYELLYGRPCITALSWDSLEDMIFLGPEILQEMEEQVCHIMKILKEAHDRQKSYADMHSLDHSFKEGESMFLRVKSQEISIKFGKDPSSLLDLLGLLKSLKGLDL